MLLINIQKVSKNIKTINIKNILRNGEIQLGTLTIYTIQYVICFESSMYITKMRQIQEVLNLQ